jgi:hypothetical protein
MMFNLPRQHPFRPGPIIDYDLLLLVRGQRERQSQLLLMLKHSSAMGVRVEDPIP